MGVNNGALVPAGNGSALEAYGTGEELQQFARRIKTLLPNGDKISNEEALAGAQLAKLTGLNPFLKEFWIVPGKGVQLNTLTERKQAGHYTWRFRMLTDAELIWHEIQQGDSAIICEGTRREDLLECRRLDIPYHNPCGIGIVRKAEKGKRDCPTGRSWGWVAEKRAQTDLARQMGAPASAEEIIAIAEAEGINVDLPDNARLSTDQAQAWAETRHADATAQAERDAMTPAERHAEAQRYTEQMRGPANFQGFGDDEPPAATVDSTARHLSAEGFEWLDEGDNEPQASDAAFEALDTPEPETLFDATQRPIDDGERKHLFGLARKLYGNDTATFRKWIHERYNIESTNMLTLAQYNDALNALDVAIKAQQ